MKEKLGKYNYLKILYSSEDRNKSTEKAVHKVMEDVCNVCNLKRTAIPNISR